MLGVIGENGVLQIIRGRSLEPMQCAYSVYPAGTKDAKLCSDKCALFGEPEKTKFHFGLYTKIKLCQGRTLVFGGFVDNRGRR